MSAHASILIYPAVPLQDLPDAERDVIRRFWTEYLRGQTAVDHKRWLRLGGALFNAAPGEGFQLYRVEERSGPFHRRHRIILERLFEMQEAFPSFASIDAMHDWLKLRTWFVEWKDGKASPRSTAFPKCSEDEIREFHNRLVDYLHTPHAQRKLFPNVPPAMRHEMVDAVLRNPNDPEDK
jgi:hypothetical protein